MTYWNKENRSYEEVTSDQNLLSAIDTYWKAPTARVCTLFSTYTVGTSAYIHIQRNKRDL